MRAIANGTVSKRVGALLLLALATATGARAGTTVVVSDAWSRPANRTGVVYAVIRNDASLPDRLIGGSSPVATRVELHDSETTMPAMSSAAMDGMPMGGSMVSMKSVVAIPIAAHGTTTLAPGGYHLMLDLRRKIAAGETIPLRLHFARAGWTAASVHVRSRS